MSEPIADDSHPRVEVKPSGRSSVGLWALVLVGPVTWISHFMVVYLVAEAACTSAGVRGMRFLDPGGLTVFILVATAVAALVTAAGAVACWSGRRGDAPDASAMHHVGLLLSAGSFVAVLFVGLPVLAIGPC